MSKPFLNYLIKINLLILILLPINAISKDLEIFSDQLVIDVKSKKALYKGNVLLIYNQLKLITSEIEVNFQNNDSKFQFNINNCVIKGKLKIFVDKNSIDSLIISDSGFIDFKSKYIELKGNINIKSQKDILVGNRMLLYL